MSTDEPVDAFVDIVNGVAGEFSSRNLSAAASFLDALVVSDPMAALRVMQQASLLLDRESLGLLGAGPLENLLAYSGEQVRSLLLDLLQSTEPLRWAFSTVSSGRAPIVDDPAFQHFYIREAEFGDS